MRSGPGRELEPLDLPDGVVERTGSLDGVGKRFAIVASRFNEDVIARLVDGAIRGLVGHGVVAGDLEVVRVPGAFELPSACQRVVERGGVDAVIALGCVIRGETPHFEYVAGAAAQGLGALSISGGVPTVFGVLTTDTLEQAIDRAGPGEDNKGWEAALSALEMVNLLRDLR